MSSHPRSSRFFFLVVALLILCSSGFAQTAAPECKPEFPFKQQWLGADAAYSIPLPDGRSVWIFGDTLHGEKRVVEGNEPRMVRNSIGISKCDAAGAWKLDYVIRRDEKGRPSDFFHARKPKTWYWALDGFYHDKNLWVTLLCIRSTPSMKDGLGFETCGSDLAKVSGLDGDPQGWRVEVFPLIEDGVRAYPSATAVVEGKYAYIFALYENGSRPMVLTRIPLEGLDAPARNLQYLAKDGNWKPGLDPKDAQFVMKQGNTEMSVRYHPGQKRWIAVMTYPKLYSDKILLRTAPEITGPWDSGKVIYTVPEMQKRTSGYDKDTFCYAGKEHPEFRQSDSILFTYACNTMKVEKLTTNLGIYFPKVVRVPLEGARASNKR